LAGAGAAGEGAAVAVAAVGEAGTVTAEIAAAGAAAIAAGNRAARLKRIIFKPKEPAVAGSFFCNLASTPLELRQMLIPTA
jgi:hypothetical protein